MPARSPGGRASPRAQKPTETNPNVDNKNQPESGSNNKVAGMIENGRKRLGDGYQGGYNGPQPVGHPVSCSDLIDSMRAAVGLPPFCSPGGTYTAFNKLAQGTISSGNLAGKNNPVGEKYQSGKNYPAGFIFVARGGQGGPDGTHMSMSIGNGQVIESIAYQNKGPVISKAPGAFPSPGEVMAGVMPDTGTSFDIPSIGEQIGNAAGGIAGALPDALLRAVTEGLLRGILLIVGFFYGYLILKPLDFVGGFWWEFTSRVIGDLAPYLEDLDIKAAFTDPNYKAPPIPSGTGTSEQNWNRFFFLLFCFLTYQLAWGRNNDGDNRIDAMLNGMSRLGNIDMKGKRAKNTRATVTAEIDREVGAERVGSGNVERGNTNGSKRGRGRKGPNDRDSTTGRFTARKETPERT